MPRKQPVRALGAKPNSVRSSRKNSPGRYQETTDKLDAAGATHERRMGRDARKCAWDDRVTMVNGKEKINRCIAEPTEFVRFAWWCATHAPERGKEGCHHCVRSPLWGRWVCQTCSIDLGAIE